MVQPRKCLALFISLLLIQLPIGSASASTSKTLLIQEADNLKVKSVHLGDQFKVVLHSTLWTMDSMRGLTLSSGPNFKLINPGPSVPANCQIRGTGCGTVTWIFKANKIGTASFVASRSSCGEALRCLPKDQRFSVKIIVKKG